MDSGERGMNPVAMTIISPQKEYWPSQGSNQRPLFSSPQRYRLSYGALSNLKAAVDDRCDDQKLINPLPDDKF